MLCFDCQLYFVFSLQNTTGMSHLKVIKTLIIFNTYCFSATSMVTRTRFNITFIRTSPVFTCALDGGEWSVSRRGRFNPKGTGCDTNWIVVWANTRVCLGALKKIKFSWTCRRIEQFLVRRPARNPDYVTQARN